MGQEYRDKLEFLVWKIAASAIKEGCVLRSGRAIIYWLPCLSYGNNKCMFWSLTRCVFIIWYLVLIVIHVRSTTGGYVFSLIVCPQGKGYPQTVEGVPPAPDRTGGTPTPRQDQSQDQWQERRYPPGKDGVPPAPWVGWGNLPRGQDRTTDRQGGTPPLKICSLWLNSL